MDRRPTLTTSVQPPSNLSLYASRRRPTSPTFSPFAHVIRTAAFAVLSYMYVDRLDGLNRLDAASSGAGCSRPTFVQPSLGWTYRPPPAIPRCRKKGTSEAYETRTKRPQKKASDSTNGLVNQVLTLQTGFHHE